MKDDAYLNVNEVHGEREEELDRECYFVSSYTTPPPHANAMRLHDSNDCVSKKNGFAMSAYTDAVLIALLRRHLNLNVGRRPANRAVTFAVSYGLCSLRLSRSLMTLGNTKLEPD